MENVEVQTTQTRKISLYEQSREERIKENFQRMKKLGIAELSLKLKSSVAPKRKRRNAFDRNSSPQSHALSTPGLLRRSSRLQNVTPVSYSVAHVDKMDKSLKHKLSMLEEGSKPEVYTEEHEKLLGNTEKSWELFVDGCGKDGKRIYDPVKGKTCHQCRQKTLGHRTRCSRCDMIQGQFCGDCLYMRYGEHVLEALENPNWVCPVCRGICNCSLCRQAKGWPPTGALYRKVSSMGYKSVAHFLIQTRRSQTNSGESENQVSAKRSLSITYFEAIPVKSSTINDNHLLKSLEHQSEDKGDDKVKNKKQNNTLQCPTYHETNDRVSVRRSLSSSNAIHEISDVGLSKMQSMNNIAEVKDVSGNIVSEKEVVQKENKLNVDKKRRIRIELATPDSIAGRLRQRRLKSEGGSH